MFEALQIVVAAMTTNGEQILLAAILLTIVIFIYSVFAYEYVLDTFWNDSFDGGENQCTSLRHCFFTMFSLVIIFDSGSKVDRKYRRHDCEAFFLARKQRQILRQIYLRFEHFLLGEHVGFEHYLWHHYSKLCPNERKTQ